MTLSNLGQRTSVSAISNRASSEKSSRYLPEPVSPNCPNEVLLGLRAEELKLGRAAEKNALVGRILTVLPTGADWFYQVEVSGQVLTIRHNDAVPFVYDDSVSVELNLSSIKVFDDLGKAVL